MAIKKTAASARYKADTLYRVRFAKVETHRATTFRPRGDYRIKGRTLNELPATSIKSAEPV